METAGQEVKDLVADGAAESYVPGFGDMFGWNYGVEARTIVNKLCDVGGLAPVISVGPGIVLFW